MPSRILTEGDAKLARRKVAFCYICGLSLPALRSRRRGEHVIPTSQLPVADDPTDQWALKLDTHISCEQVHKNQNDNLLAVVLRLNLQPSDEGPKGQHLNTVRKLVRGYHNEQGMSCGLEVNRLNACVSVWVRGLHAALYKERAPASLGWIEPPTRMFAQGSDPASITVQMTAAETRTRAVLKTIDAAHSSDVWDGLQRRGGDAAYHCVWIRMAGISEMPAWRCVWRLILPEHIRWSGLVRPDPVPWHGCYWASRLPPGASVLTTMPATTRSGGDGPI